MPASRIPFGWSADPKDLDKASTYFPKTAYGINSKFAVEPLLVELGPNATYLVECPQGKGTYYLWNEISDEVWKFVTPARLEEILPLLVNPNLKGLDIQPLEPVGEKVEFGSPVRA